MGLAFLFVLILVVGGCTSSGPLAPQIACDVEKFQPLAVGKYWVYERVDSSTMQTEVDSIVVESSTVVEGRTVFTIRRFTADSLQSTLEATFAAEQMLEVIPGIFNDLLNKKSCLCPDARGVVLYCGTELPGVRGSRPGDSLPSLDSTGEVVKTVTQYRWATSGTHASGTFKDLGPVLFGPSPIDYTPTRTVNMVVNDSMVIVEPLDATFPNGKRFMPSETKIVRTYLYNVGMISESLEQTSDSFGDFPQPPVRYVRRLVRYGRK
ncbi:MAG: hypothetical protein IPM83_04375 [Ignavibacteria bacterium]|nr:hypothetical protein [Ignavibacteria bacterium]